MGVTLLQPTIFVVQHKMLSAMSLPLFPQLSYRLGSCVGLQLLSFVGCFRVCAEKLATLGSFTFSGVRGFSAIHAVAVVL